MTFIQYWLYFSCRCTIYLESQCAWNARKEIERIEINRNFNYHFAIFAIIIELL